MTVITLSQVKTQLGLKDSTYDTMIEAKIPIIDSKVKAICRNNFNYRFAADMTSGESTISVYPLYQTKDNFPSGINNNHIYRDITKSLEIGMQITGDNIPDETYIENYYKVDSVDVLNITSDLVYVEISNAVTDDGSSIDVTGGIAIGYLDVIANGIWWMIQQTSTTINNTGWVSRSEGPLNVNKGESNAKIDGKSGMPAWFVKALPRFI